jgi:hypothetical protein
MTEPEFTETTVVETDPAVAAAQAPGVQPGSESAEDSAPEGDAADDAEVTDTAEGETSATEGAGGE